MNIAIFDTTIGSSNHGDEVIQNSIFEAMEPLFNDSFIMRFSTHLTNFRLFNYLVNDFKIQFSNKCDYKFIMGTNLLSSNLIKSNGQWPIGPISAKLYKNAILVGVGTTFGSRKPSLFSRAIYEKILRKDIFHSVRDEESKAFLESIGYKAINTGCPTLWKLTPEFCSQIPSKKSRNVIISLSGYDNQKSEREDTEMLRQLNILYDTKFFWVQTVADEQYLRKLPIDSSDYKIIYSFKTFADICKKNDVDYVGTRLHGGVFALQNKVRALVIAIDHRAQGFHDDNNLNIIKRSDIAELSDLLSSDMPTEIKINQAGICCWKEQFAKSQRGGGIYCITLTISRINTECSNGIYCFLLILRYIRFIVIIIKGFHYLIRY